MPKPTHEYVIIPMIEANGHVQQCSGDRKLCDTLDQAIEAATGMLDKRSYNSMYIYRAVIQVRRTAPPIEIIQLNLEEEE